MKYIDFKIFKFSTILKNIKRIQDSFSGFRKAIKNISRNITGYFGYIFSVTNKSIKFIINYFSKIYKQVDFRRLNFKKIYKYFDLRRYDFYRIDKKIKLANYKNFQIYLFSFLVFACFVYLVIPKFYSYDKSKIEKIVCNKQNIECLVKGKIYYNFFPSPRIKIKNLVVNDISKKNILITAEDVSINLSIKNLFSKDKHEFKKIKFNNFEINFNFKNFKEYKKIFTMKNNFIPVKFEKGQIIFFDGKNYVATINKTNLNLKLTQNTIDSKLKGKFLNDDISINLNSENVDNKAVTEIILKMSDMNFLTKINLTNPKNDKNIIQGNFLVKKDKSRITAFFDHKDGELIINKSNLRNAFLDGKLEGKIVLLPYFNFNLDLNLNSLNFTKLYNYFLALDKEDKKKIFKINNKINGKLNLSAEKVYSKYNLIKSFESRLKFSNGTTFIEQFLFNLGKLGAADILGTINDDKKFTNFKFESNVFIDNQKKFLSKFGIYNKETINSNLFVSGNFDLQKLKLAIYEISDNKKFKEADINYIEKEFNNLMFEDGYKNLFHFPNFKEFIKSVTSE